MSRRCHRPDFLIVGAPKAGTSALHAALARHPDVYVPSVKEPKYYLCGDAPPPLYRGPGDAHSRQEWIWRRHDYQALFADAPPYAMRGESTPFYLANEDAQRRIADDLPGARLIAVLRDPVDRAYSNWMHLRADGLEPNGDFVDAFEREPQRVSGGFAPFWHYRELGMYGRQLRNLYERFERSRVLLLRYRELVDTPDETLDRVSRFLGIREGAVRAVPTDNARPYVSEGVRTRMLTRAIRAGASVGSLLPPQVWRSASKPLIEQLRRGSEERRPALTPEQRARLVASFTDDIRLLEELTGDSFADWLDDRRDGSFMSRLRERASA